jgi:hypothetical protein
MVLALTDRSQASYLQVCAKKNNPIKPIVHLRPEALSSTTAISEFSTIFSTALYRKKFDTAT